MSNEETLTKILNETIQEIDISLKTTEVPLIETETIPQEKSSSFDTIVLSGNSIKGIVTLGSLQYLTDNFLLNNITNYIGTSSGAMCCYLLAIGYTPIEVIVYICTNQILEKMQYFNVVAMLNGSGASSFTPIQEQLEKMTIEKIGKLLTFKDIKDIYKKNLICVAHNLSTGKTEYIGPDTYPDLPCLIGLRMSANLPLIFDHYKYNGSFWLDGGISNNFAINKACEIGNKIIGVTVTKELDDFKCENIDTNILEYIYKLMFIPIYNCQNYMIEQALNKNTNCTIIKLSYPKLKLFNFSINSTDKLEMFSYGYQQTNDFFTK